MSVTSIAQSQVNTRSLLRGTFIWMMLGLILRSIRLPFVAAFRNRLFQLGNTIFQGLALRVVPDPGFFDPLIFCQNQCTRAFGHPRALHLWQFA